MYKELVDEVNIIDQINTAKNALEHRASESGKMINVTIKGDIPESKVMRTRLLKYFITYLIMLLNTQMMGVQ